MKILSERPFGALRFLILQNVETEEYKWLFNSNQSDHAEMESMFQSEYGRDWRAVCGGFYTMIRNDVTPVLLDGIKVNTLYLFDLSGSFGMDVITLKENLPKLEAVLGKYTRVLTTYNK